MNDAPGKRLREAREARGLSVEDVTSVTKMRPNIIVALEADDYTRFPSITHARNFLSLYAKYLKVDASAALSSLATPAKIGVENYQYLNVERNETTSYRTQRRSRSSSGPRDGKPFPFGTVALVLAFFLFVGYLWINLQRLNLASGTREPGTEPVAEVSPTPAVAEPNPVTKPSPGKRKEESEPSSTPFYTPPLEDRQLIPSRRRPPE
ncbi:MAG TPA: helix-turn-helix domain-containing protein [Chthoniobacterales bacterium]|jgi:cytoskeletal protein RodZ